MRNLERWLLYPIVLLLLFALAWVYSEVLRHELIFDDARFTDSIFLGAQYELQLGFRSLPTASFHWIHDWLGSEWRWQRAINVALHVANTVALWVLTDRLLRRGLNEAGGTSSRTVHWSAVVGVTYWAFNPVGAYAVGYLIQRSILMATFFVVLMMLAFVEMLSAQERRKRAICAALTIACYGLAILSKEHAAPSIGLLLPLYVYWCRPSSRAIMSAGLPLLIFTFICGWLLFRIQGWSLGANVESNVKKFMEELEALSPEAARQVYPLSVVNQLWLFFRYGFLWVLPWPGWLSIDMRPSFPLKLWEMPQMLGAVGYLALVTGATWSVLCSRGLSRLVAFAVLIPAIFFVTELAYVRLQEPFVLYRSYLWSIAIPILIAVVVARLSNDFRVYIVAIVIIGGIFAMGLSDRISSLRNNLVVWGDAAAKVTWRDPKSTRIGDWRPHFNYATYLLKARDYQAAYANIEVARQLGLPELEYRVNAGGILIGGGRPDLGRRVLEPLMAVGDAPFTAYFNLAAAYKFTGAYQQALDAFDRGLQNPKVPIKVRAEILADAGSVAVAVKDWVRAERYFREQYSLEPERPEGIVGIANVLYERARLYNVAQARSCFMRALTFIIKWGACRMRARIMPGRWN